MHRNLKLEIMHSSRRCIENITENPEADIFYNYIIPSCTTRSCGAGIINAALLKKKLETVAIKFMPMINQSINQSTYLLTNN